MRRLKAYSPMSKEVCQMPQKEQSLFQVIIHNVFGPPVIMTLPEGRAKKLHGLLQDKGLWTVVDQEGFKDYMLFAGHEITDCTLTRL